MKTRLAAELGEEKALELYSAMTRDLVESIGRSSETTCVEVLWTADEADGPSVRRLFPGYELSTQCGADLGERLLLGFHERIVFYRAEKVIAIGTDDPTLTRSAIENAFALLDSCDWVIGPAADGGYYLIGCRAGSFDLSLFQNIQWGTSEVLPRTLARLKELHECVALLPTRHDLDVVDDVRAFSQTAASGRTLELLREWGWA